MRTFALALLCCLVATTDSSSLRGSNQERRLGCDPQGSKIWIDMALASNLDPAIWADKFWQICVDDSASNETRTETLKNGCWSTAVISPWVALLTGANSTDMKCTTNVDCRNEGGICHWRYLASACTPDSDSMQGECGSVIANPDISE